MKLEELQVYQSEINSIGVKLNNYIKSIGTKNYNK